MGCVCFFLFLLVFFFWEGGSNKVYLFNGGAGEGTQELMCARPALCP